MAHTYHNLGCVAKLDCNRLLSGLNAGSNPVTSTIVGLRTRRPRWPVKPDTDGFESHPHSHLGFVAQRLEQRPVEAKVGSSNLLGTAEPYGGGSPGLRLANVFAASPDPCGVR